MKSQLTACALGISILSSVSAYAAPSCPQIDGDDYTVTAQLHGGLVGEPYGKTLIHFIKEETDFCRYQLVSDVSDYADPIVQGAQMLWISKTGTANRSFELEERFSQSRLKGEIFFAPGHLTLTLSLTGCGSESPSIVCGKDLFLDL